MRPEEPEVPVWLDDLRGHRVFRDELDLCEVGGLIEINTTGPPIKQKLRRQPLVRRQMIDEEVDAEGQGD